MKLLGMVVLTLFFSPLTFAQQGKIAEKKAQKEGKQEINFKTDHIEGHQLKPELDQESILSIRGFGNRPVIGISDETMCKLTKDVTDQYHFDRTKCQQQKDTVKGSSMKRKIGFTFFSGPAYNFVSTEKQGDVTARTGGVLQYNGIDNNINLGLTTNSKQIERAQLEVLLRKWSSESPKQLLHLEFTQDAAMKKKWEVMGGTTLIRGSQENPTDLTPFVGLGKGYHFRSMGRIEGGMVKYDFNKRKGSDYATAYIRLAAKAEDNYCQSLDKKEVHLFCALFGGEISIGSSGWLEPFGVEVKSSAGVAYARQLSIQDGKRSYFFIKPEVSFAVTTAQVIEQDNVKIQGVTRGGITIGVTK